MPDTFHLSEAAAEIAVDLASGEPLTKIEIEMAGFFKPLASVREAVPFLRRKNFVVVNRWIKMSEAEDAYEFLGWKAYRLMDFQQTLLDECKVCQARTGFVSAAELVRGHYGQQVDSAPWAQPRLAEIESLGLLESVAERDVYRLTRDACKILAAKRRP